MQRQYRRRQGEHKITIGYSFAVSKGPIALFESNPKSLRSANRAFMFAPVTRGRNYLGFRVAKTLKGSRPATLAAIGNGTATAHVDAYPLER
jgi:hypothetical protein